MVVPGPVAAETCLRLTWAPKVEVAIMAFAGKQMLVPQPITKDLELGIEISSGG
jgi:hypothetical protein